MSSENSLLIKVANQSQEKLADLKKNSINEKILFELKQMGTVLKKPHIKNTFLACVSAFCVPAAYFALYLWLPEIFQRFAEFEAKNKNEKPNFCKVSREIYSSLSTTVTFITNTLWKRKQYINFTFFRYL